MNAFEDALTAIYKPVFIPWYRNRGSSFRPDAPMPKAGRFEIAKYSGVHMIHTYRYMFTKERAQLDGVYGFLAIRYEIDLDKDVPLTKIQQIVPFKTKWRCKDQAYRWYCKAKGVPFKSLHRKREATEAQKKRFEQWEKEQGHD